MNEEMIATFLFNQIDYGNKEIEDVLQPMGSGSTDGVDVQALTRTVNRLGLKASEDDIRRYLMSSRGKGLAELIKRKANPYVFDPSKFSSLRTGANEEEKSKSEGGQILRNMADKFAQSIYYLDTCGKFTFEKFLEANQIAGTDQTESRLRILWDEAQKIYGAAAGAEFVKDTFRESLDKGMWELKIDAISMESKKKWWQFWK